MPTYIKLFVDYLDAIEPLGDAERGRLFTSLLEYARTGAAPQLCGNERFLFPMMKAQIDRDNKALEELSQIRSQAGKMGGRPQKQAKPKKANGFCESKKSYDKDNDKEKDKDYDKDQDNIPGGASAFDLFWKAYPKKVGKIAAKKAFDRVKVPVETLLSAIERQKCGEQWQRDNGQYIPNPATWLNGGRWEDEVQAPPKGKGQAAREASYDLSAFDDLALFGGGKD